MKFWMFPIHKLESDVDTKLLDSFDVEGLDVENVYFIRPLEVEEKDKSDTTNNSINT